MKKLFSLLVLSSSLFTYCTAQISTIENFTGTNGELPNGSLIISNGTLYGVTSYGGAHNVGCIFSVDAAGGNYKDMYDFNNTLGANPQGSLITVGNKLYGMATYGGANSVGCVFSIDTNGTNYKDLWDFNSPGTNGEYPDGSLLYVNGLLFGMTNEGGVNADGNIFSIDTNGSNYKDLWDFSSASSNGEYPIGSLITSGGVLYGMTYDGGNFDSGCVFSIDTNGSHYKNMLDFNGPNKGMYPYGDLVLSGKTLFGMTYGGGANDSGCIFSIDTNGANYKDLTDFNRAKGYYPEGSLTLVNNLLYGMARTGAGLNDSGCIFSIDTAGTDFNDVFDFNGVNGEYPTGNVALSGTTLYGMTPDGGTGNDGVVFSFKNISLAVNKVLANAGTIGVYPNPSSGQFTLQIKNYELGIRNNVEVYNVLGEQVYSQFNIQNPTFNIDLSSNANGIYLLRILNTDGTLVTEKKLIKTQ
jgi:uncharacterized repeat protein (TIGR03803 family)